MAEVRQDGEATGDWRERPAADGDATVVAPRFDEREAATARPVVPLGDADHIGKRNSGNFSRRVNSRHLLLAWAVIATLAAGGFALFRSVHTSEAQTASQPVPESTPGEALAVPQPTRREIPVARTRVEKPTEARSLLPSRELPERPDGWEDKADEADEEELDERARKEEKRQRKEEKKRREEAEKETERALKDARKLAERLRERQKDGGGKARLIGVISGQH